MRLAVDGSNVRNYFEERSEFGIVFVRAVRCQYDAQLCHCPRTTDEGGGQRTLLSRDGSKVGRGLL